MDDLSGLDWNSKAASKPQPSHVGSNYSTLRLIPPLSGRSTPFSNHSTSDGIVGAVRTKTSTPVNDSFAALISFTAPQSTKTNSLQEQQKILQEQRAKQEDNRRMEFDAHFGGQAEPLQEPLKGSRSTPDRVGSATRNSTGRTDEYKSPIDAIEQPRTRVNTSSHAPIKSSSDHSEPAEDLLAFDDSPPAAGTDYGDNQNTFPKVTVLSHHIIDGDDGPFGLNADTKMKINPQDSNGTQSNEDDVLGLLGRPASELPPRKMSTTLPIVEPLDHALAELMDMGFPAEKSKEALAQTESGIDVQSAVGLLLQQAHQRSHQKQRKPRGYGGNDHLEVFETSNDVRQAKTSEVESTMPAWLRQQNRSNSQQRRTESRSPVNGEKDPTKIAAEIGNNLFKTANSLWKTGAKKLNQAVSEFNSDSDTSQPKWMREAKVESETQEPRKKNRSRKSDDHVKASDSRRPPDVRASNITDEALLLESADAPHKPQRKPPAILGNQGTASSRDTSPAVACRQLNHKKPVPQFMQQPPTRPSTMKLNREAIEEQMSQAYISPARRKKAGTTPPTPRSADADLLLEVSQSQTKPTPNAISANGPGTKVQPKIQASARTPLPARPPAQTRDNPPIAAAALQSSIAQRRAGTSAFKCGDFASATTSFTSALSFLPKDHVLTIPLLTNRALSNLKIGDPKCSIADARAALRIVGPSNGDNEMIELGPGEGNRKMSAFWGEAMMRQAEALEQLEKWNEAASVWKICVEAGVGAPTSTQGRTRCEKAAGRDSISVPTRRAPPPKKIAPKPITRASMLDDLSDRPNIATSEQSAEAVSRLRAANAEADKVDEEKFALADVVDERLSKWRKGKEGNLRALLASLETVLWEGSGWRKVGMHELIVPGKVKVVYMKGIGRVHPDKLPQSATTEQKMISANVFATLNEAWDGFKKENGL